jgi:hypothetical protein
MKLRKNEPAGRGFAHISRIHYLPIGKHKFPIYSDEPRTASKELHNMVQSQCEKVAVKLLRWVCAIRPYIRRQQVHRSCWFKFWTFS